MQRKKKIGIYQVVVWKSSNKFKMGVRGLTTYINLNQDVLLQHYLLHDCCLVIDGHSLCAQLYRLLNCFSAFGGNYDKFATFTKKFFKHLKKCQISPYVIFDGSYECRKLKTAYQRLRSKINGASRLDPVTQDSLQIFPLLLRDVFKEALRDMNVSYTTCEFEADDEIAALARHLNCPVLSYDSDFFIYNVLYIPFNTLNFKPTPIEINGSKVFVLHCKIYEVQKFCSHFGSLKEDMLPLLATLLGNDYVEKKVFKKFFSEMKLPKSKKTKNEQQRCINGLFKWLQNETLESAISKILSRLKKNQKHNVLTVIKKSIDGYYSKDCRSIKYFNISNIDPLTTSHFVVSDVTNTNTGDVEANTGDIENDNNSGAEESDDDSSSTSKDSTSEDEEEQLVLGLPDWFADRVRHNTIPHSFINLYTHHLYFCSPQAEDYTEKDSFTCTLPILRYGFDILTDFSHDYCIYVSRENNNQYQRILVDKEYAVTRLLNIPFQDLTKDQLILYFSHFIRETLPKLDLRELDVLPNNFKLYMICILWWVSKCEVPLAHVYSLFICYIMLEVVDERTGTFRGHYHFNNKFGKKIEELKKNSTSLEEELFLNKNKVSYDDCLVAAGELLKNFELDDKIRKRPKSYNIKRIHSLAQFQCCLLQFNSLNILCGMPYETTKYSKCYNGTFIYNIAGKLETQIDLKLFIEQYLKGSGMVLMLFKSLCKVYEDFVQRMAINNIKWISKKRSRKKNTSVVDEINFIVKGFESEVII